MLETATTTADATAYLLTIYIDAANATWMATPNGGSTASSVAKYFIDPDTGSSPWLPPHMPTRAFPTARSGLGLWRGDPVVTYGILSGFERRVVGYVIIFMARLPFLVLQDVARLYFATKMDVALFGMISSVVCGLLLLAFNVPVNLLQRLPCPNSWRYKVVRIASPPMNVTALLVSMGLICVGDNRARYFDCVWTTDAVDVGIQFGSVLYRAGGASHHQAVPPVFYTLWPYYATAIAAGVTLWPPPPAPQTWLLGRRLDLFPPKRLPCPS
ncbi:Aste57867_3687 [Aphanomyces stellatus]|uniref:Aste57867_3687 protein n=1 Tax=Aphanomyces stellatus TaxID=120398 RepID=A0A485KA71_9STRA|nr:hypothetical protein As57867_003676 [Aphanomyces stellatus]VFT80842.1 Aste57867_3687 [Aphanomyces stellatus]